MDGLGAGSQINFSGLASGMATGDIVDALVKVGRIPVARIERQNAIHAAHKDAYEAVLSSVKDLYESATAMDRAQELRALKAVSSDASVLQATAGTNAQPASHRLEVKQLATGQRTYSDAVSSRNGKGQFGEGSIHLQHGNKQADISVDDSTTLDDVMARINASDVQLQASVVDEGGSFRLVLASQATGAAAAFTMHESGTSLGLGNPAHTKMQAQDARLVLDGAVDVTRSSNTINDLVEGVTLTLTQQSDVVQTVSVAPSAEGMKEKISKFIESYNQTMGVLTAITTPQEVKNEDPDHPRDPSKPQYDIRNMPADFNLVSLMRRLQGVVSSKVVGATDNFSSLGLVGILSGADGRLKVDDKKLDAAIAQNPEDITKLFTKTFGRSDGVAEQIGKIAFEQSSVAGGLSLGIAGFAERIRRNAVSINEKEQRLKLYEMQLKRRFADMESNISSLSRQRNQLNAMSEQNKK